MRDLNFVIRRSDIFIVMGGSGCGKSTVLRHLLGLKEPAKGEISYRDFNFTRATRATRASDAAFRDPVPGRRTVEFDDVGPERPTAAGGIY
jgi:ABC-type Fe3+/spermidine/putrescine transport system ATPase subunit